MFAKIWRNMASSDRPCSDLPGKPLTVGTAALMLPVLLLTLLAGGVLPIIKHIPGHGRAFADSHHDLPVVETALETLDAWDFAPFKALSDMPMAMTAHVVGHGVPGELEPGFTAFVAKPFEPDLLLDLLLRYRKADQAGFATPPAAEAPTSAPATPPSPPPTAPRQTAA